MDAFREFVGTQFGGAESYIDPRERLGVADFEMAERLVTLPALTPPSSISQKIVPAEARQEADRLKQLLELRQYWQRHFGPILLGHAHFCVLWSD